MGCEVAPKAPSPKPSSSPWAAFEYVQGYTISEGVGGLKGTQVGSVFRDKLKALVEAGKFSPRDAGYLIDGVSKGFDLGLDESMMKGKRVFRNYPTAYEAKEKVSDALRARVEAGKTLKLGAFDGDASKLPGECATVVPMGAVAKKLEPDKVRPFSDHTKTCLNAAARDRIEHTLDTYDEIAKELKPGYFARIEDVDAAFPVLPLHPRVWNHMLIWWYDVDRPLEDQPEGPNTLYSHVFADFGTAPLPGIWDLFWKAIKAMAEHDGVLTLPMPHFVDDNTLIGPSEEEVNRVGEELSDYVEALGVPFKRLKTRKAADRQLVLGFWWDSVLRTRSLEEGKLEIYIDFLLEMASKSVLTLAELRVLIGRMHRASMTMPSGSKAFLGSVLKMLRGLRLPHHRRRMTKMARRDILKLVEILRSNHGQGYFDTSHLPWADPIWTDAMKDPSSAGWGWCCGDGQYDRGWYHGNKQRRWIDELEGDAVERAMTALGHKCANKRVPIYIDNSAFQLSLKKGWSHAERLTEIIKNLYSLSVEHNCVLVPIWISTHDNVGADALSRGDMERFKSWASMHLENEPRQYCR